MRPRNQTNPKKAKIQKVATLCLGALFVLLLVKTLLSKDDTPTKPKRAAAQTQETGSLEVAQSPDDDTDDDTWERLELDALRQRLQPTDSAACAVPSNPFRPSPQLEEELTGKKPRKSSSPLPPTRKRIQFKLKGIVADHSNGERIAWIDKEMLRVGDRHRGYTVVEITPSQVVLESREERRVLRLEER